MKVALGVLFCALCCSCAREGEKRPSTNNLKVELITEFDGCKVYRFYDAGHWVYVSKCGVDSEAAWEQNDGKHTHPTGTKTTIRWRSVELN